MLNESLKKSLNLIDDLLKGYTKEELLLELKIYDHLEEENEFIINSIINNLENSNYSLENIKTNKEQLLKQYNNLSKLLELKNIDIYNSILKNINIEKLDVIIIISLLRLSYFFKQEINEWNIFLNKSILEFNKRNLETNKLLKGLI